MLCILITLVIVFGQKNDSDDPVFLDCIMFVVDADHTFKLEGDVSDTCRRQSIMIKLNKNNELVVRR